MILFGNKNESYLGIDIGANGIKLVELRNNKNRPQLITYGIANKKLDIHSLFNQNKIDERKIDEYAELLKFLIKKTKAQSRIVISSLPVTQVFHAVINFPKVDKSELDNLVKVKIKKMISRPIDEMQLIYQIVNSNQIKDDKFIKVLVIAASKKMISLYTEIFKRAGLQLQELETEAFALSRSLIGFDKNVAMIVDIGYERTNLFIIDNGFPLTYRTLQIGGKNFDQLLSEKLGVELNVASQIKKDLSMQTISKINLERFAKFLDPLTKEIQYNFDIFLRQLGNEIKRPEKIVLTGGVSLFPVFIDYIKKHFSLKVFIGDPWARVIYQDSLKPVLDSLGPRMSVAIGLALRNFDKK